MYTVSMSSFLYFFREALKGFTRHASTTVGSIITIFLSLLIIGISAIAGSIVQNVMNSIENEVSITAYVADGASAETVQSVQDWIGTLDGVSQVSYTTKEQALEDFKESMASSPEIVNQLDGENPLPASINVDLTDPQKVESVANQIQSNSDFATVCDNPDDPSESLKYGQKTVERLFSLTNTVRYIGYVLIVLLIVIAFIFINNTVRLAILARRREISIMRLVGASNGFIRGPFLMEGALHAFVGAILAVLCLELIRRFALPMLTNALMWLPITVEPSTYALVYISLLIAGLVIGMLGALMAMRRYLKI